MQKRDAKASCKKRAAKTAARSLGKRERIIMRIASAAVLAGVAALGLSGVAHARPISTIDLSYTPSPKGDDRDDWKHQFTVHIDGKSSGDHVVVLDFPIGPYDRDHHQSSHIQIPCDTCLAYGTNCPNTGPGRKDSGEVLGG